MQDATGSAQKKTCSYMTVVPHLTGTVWEFQPAKGSSGIYRSDPHPLWTLKYPDFTRATSVAH